ncbi:MAG: molybdopterin-dependent oxidoreductase [Chloroflexi bacterium]|nr:molybdopterin-dependent oxidoreductase [Chloroflexota bacterium]
MCGIRVRVVDGCPVKVEGLDQSDMGAQGGTCTKGLATVMDYNDPNRCNYPVKRSNPKKGIHEDPKWQRISWEEALDIITEKLREVRRKDPRALLWGPTVLASLKAATSVTSFFAAFGTNSVAGGGNGAYCGNVNYTVGTVLANATVDMFPDYKYCNYVLQCGGSIGMAGGRMPGVAVRQAADARDKGMKTIVMDPIGYVSGGKATEWIPILPATDSAVFLAIANLIVNEIGVYDKEFIRHKTNGAYLVAPDRLFIRDKESGKPLLWDEKDCRAKTYNDPTLSFPSIGGEYAVGGIKCQPAFQLLKEHLREYEPAWASKVSGVPESIIRRLARELVEEARIGSTIEINGVKVPYRPACVVGYKGLHSHQNAFPQQISLILINVLLGNLDVAGGVLSSGMVRSLGYPETGYPCFEPYPGYDGMLTPGVGFTAAQQPGKEVKSSGSINFSDILVHCSGNAYPYCDDWDAIWTKAGRPFEPQVLALYGGNVVANCANSRSVARFLENIPFTFCVNTIHNETTEGFADVVLPECHFLESLEIFSSTGFTRNYPPGPGKWSFHVRTPVVPPRYERRDTLEIFSELADRLEIRSEFNMFLGNRLRSEGIKGREPKGEKHRMINPDEKISSGELADRVLKYCFGQERGLGWFREHGFLTWPKRVEECYWRYFVNARVPVYFEVLERNREKIREAAEKIGIHVNWEYYTPLVSYFPSVIYTEVPGDSEFDLIAISHRDVLHSHRFSAGNPWIDEMSSHNPYTNNIVMNAQTAESKGIDDGDTICVESRWGRVTGRVKLAQAIHPQVIGMVSLGGWAKGRAIARGKGVNFNELLKADHKHMCPISGALELAVRVKAYRFRESKARPRMR